MIPDRQQDFCVWTFCFSSGSLIQSNGTFLHTHTHTYTFYTFTLQNLLLGSLGCWFFPVVFRLLSSVKITSPFCSPFFLCRIGGSLFNCPAVFLLRFCVTCAVVILPNGEGHYTGQTSGGGCGKAMLANRDPASDLILWTLAYGWETISPALCKAGL